MAHLSLSLLGPFQVTLDGEPVTGFESSKVRALLVYLAVEAHRNPKGRLRTHRRETLAGLLWPDRPDRAAFASLRNALSNLRTVIGDRDATHTETGGPPFLDVTRETIQFNPASDHWLDVAAFQGLAETPATGRSARERLEEAIVLYRGDFLAGFTARGSPEFDNWSLVVRERLQRQALDALRRLVTSYEGNGEIGRACEIAWRWVELAPWEETAHQSLMRLLARSGQRGAALAQYEACCQILADELGVEPGPETTALYERIRDRDLDPVALPSFLRASPPDVRPPFHFVARERELALLDGYLAEALTGQGRVVFVKGEAGTGKTALVGEYARRAQEKHAGLVVAGGNCNAYTGSGDPYLPFREILGQLTGDVESRWMAGALSTEGARRLWNGIPLTVQSLVDVGPDLVDSLLAASPLAARAATAAPGGAGWRDRLETLLATEKVGRRQSGLRQVDLYAQVTALLTTLAQDHSLLLTLDDLQWADAGTIDLLFHLGRRLAGSRILVAGIYRPSEVAMDRDGGRHPLAPVIHEFQRQFGAIEVHLPQGGDRQFVETLLDSESNCLGGGFRDALYQHTRGHALFTVEMLRGMQERGELLKDRAGRWVEGAGVDWRTLPARVEGAIGARIDRLPPALRETLAVASVEGETFTAQVVARVRGAAEPEIVRQLSGELDRRHQLVVSEGSLPAGPGRRRASRYRFRHILFQAYVYGGLDEAERACLHEAVGNAIQEAYAGQDGAMAVQLARHYSAAGRMERAATFYLQAGDRAQGLYAYTEARQHYGRALSTLVTLSDTVENRQRRVDALIGHTSCSMGTDSLEKNLANLGEAEQLAQGLPGPGGTPGGDRLRLGRVRLVMGHAHYARGALREAITQYERVLFLARELGDSELIARSSFEIGEVLIMQGDYGKAEALLRQAISLFECMGRWSEWCRALSGHGGALVMRGDCATGWAEIQRARARAEEISALNVVMYNNYLLNTAYIVSGDFPRAMDLSDQMVAWAERAGNQIGIYVGHYHQFWAASRAGQYDAAAAHAANAQAVAQKIGGRLAHDDHIVAFGAENAFGAGRVQEAIALAKRAVEIAQEMGGIFAEGVARRAWGQALAALDPPQWDEAEVQLARSLHLLESGHVRLEAARTREAWGAVCRDRGDLAAAQVHWEKAAAQWERSGLCHELAYTKALIQSLVAE